MTSPIPSVHVIGRGIAGLAVAYELARRGVPVVVHGPKERPGSGTRAAVGVASVKGNIQANSELFKAKLAAQSFLPAWLAGLERDSGTAIPRLGGTLEPFHDLKGYEAIRERVFHRLFTGCLRVKVMQPKDLTKAFHSLPGFAASVRGAFLYPDDLWVDPTAVLEALERACLARGARISEAEVERLSPLPDRGVGVETTEGSVAAAEVVVAAGAFTSPLLAASGLPRLPLESVAGETLVGPAPQGVDAILNRGKVNLALFGGRFLYGSSSRVVRAPADAAPSSFFAEDLRRALASFAGLSTDRPVLWGLRSRVKDQSPVVGPLFWSNFELRRVWISAAFYKNGLQLAPLLARDLATAILDRDSTFCLPSAFLPSRL